MKKAILGAALFSAALALAGPAKADATSDFWAVVVKDISALLIGPSNGAGSSDLLVGSAGADATGPFLSGSTNALILGPTGIPTPDAAYISDAENLYLDPNGYDGTTATTLALTTPETNNFTTSGCQIVLVDGSVRNVSQAANTTVNPSAVGLPIDPNLAPEGSSDFVISMYPPDTTAVYDSNW